MDEREIEHVRKREYNRGWTDAKTQRATETWQFDRERRMVVDALGECDFIYTHVPDNLEVLLAAFGITGSACYGEAFDRLRDRLVYLLGGEGVTDREPSKFIQCSPIRREPLDEERHRVLDDLESLELATDGDSHTWLSQICHAVLGTEKVVWDETGCHMLVGYLRHLLEDDHAYVLKEDEDGGCGHDCACGRDAADGRGCQQAPKVTDDDDELATLLRLRDILRKVVLHG